MSDPSVAAQSPGLSVKLMCTAETRLPGNGHVCQCSRFPGDPCTQPHRCFCGHTWRTPEPDDDTYQLDHAGAEVLDGTNIAALQTPHNDTAERLRLALEVINELTTINTQLHAENAALKAGNAQ